MLDYQFPVSIMNQLKSVYNIPFLDSYSHPIDTCLSMIASYVHAGFWNFGKIVCWHPAGFQSGIRPCQNK